MTFHTALEGCQTELLQSQPHHCIPVVFTEQNLVTATQPFEHEEETAQLMDCSME